MAADRRPLRSLRSRACLLGLLVSAISACAPVAARLPSELHEPAAGRADREHDDSDPLEEARRVCQYVESMSARVRVSGTIEGRRIRRDLSVGTRLETEARFESSADATRAPFTLWATTHQRSLLYFPQSQQLVESASPDGLIESVLGLPIGLADLAQLTMGCPQIQSESTTVRIRPGWLRVSHEHDQWYLYRASDEQPWSLVAIDHHSEGTPFGWRARFLEQHPGDRTPRRLRITSLDGNGAEGGRFDVHLMFSGFQQQPVVRFDEKWFSIPASATRTAIEDVKEPWPLVALTESR
jgi:hypothetical protein